jgi:hypothetical protein
MLKLNDFLRHDKLEKTCTFLNFYDKIKKLKEKKEVA